MATTQLSQEKLIRLVLSRAIAGVVVIAAMFFIPAGTLNYWQAWVVFTVVFVPALFVFVWLLRHDPALLERRMRYREPHQEQKRILVLTYPLLILMFLLPGLDRRFGWSHMPAIMNILADAVVLAGYALFIYVLRENSFLSRVIEVAQGQRVISTGPYAFVRHPMYVAALLMYLALPIALGSYWALIPALMMVPMFIARILNEERVLAQELPGYVEYTRKVKYRLVPGIW